MENRIVTRKAQDSLYALAKLGFGYLRNHPVTGKYSVPSICIDGGIAFEAEYRGGKEIAFQTTDILRNISLLGHELVHHQQFLSYEAGGQSELAEEHWQLLQGIWEPSEYRAALTEAYIHRRDREVEGCNRFPLSTAAKHAWMGREEFKTWFNTMSNYPRYFQKQEEANACR